ncbi:hypothetical protein [Bacillus sp. FSL K6-3431]|uniref:hypothetical protein n=1 Tax=Bacillus sp. FSL K6-3431 TaxID=2921500 RepID=UPI0030F66CBA
MENDLHFLKPATTGWETKALTCSALQGDGIESIWGMIQDFTGRGKSSDVFYDRRNTQVSEWLISMVKDRLEVAFFQDEQVKKIRKSIEDGVEQGKLTVLQAEDAYQGTLYKRTEGHLPSN